jgi:demethylmenaquinone methyltransferase/2-methoxy-6-polyprenyl-1,4-benzoquinol methylase
MHLKNPEEKKKFVREKFSSISKDYDFLNTLLSFNIDRYWRWVTTRMLREFPDGAVLDLCAGTLPLALELTRQAPRRQVLAIDFCEAMLRAGIRTMPGDDRRQRILPVCGDGEKIPVATTSVWGITVAFGVRNLSRTAEGLREMHRVLRPGGKLLILELSRPRNPLVKPFYNFYLNRVLPNLAGMISGDKEAYQYLASSIAGFYEPEELSRMMSEAGFAKVYRRPLTFGVVTIFVGVK